MPKTDLMFIIAVTLPLDIDWSKMISLFLAFLAGMSLFIADEWKRNNLSFKNLFIRVLNALGLIYAGYLLREYFKPEWDMSFIVFICTFLGEFLVAVGGQVLKKKIGGYLDYLSGNVPQNKEENND